MIHLFVTTNYHTGGVATLLCALRCKAQGKVATLELRKFF